MSSSEKIKILCVKLGISVAELARRCNQSPQNFNSKMKRESFTVKELEEIAATVECTFENHFVLPTGDKV